MARPDMSLMVVGAPHADKDGGNRLLEVTMCVAGELVVLAPEPRNSVDPNAVAMFSARRIQIGYASAERCG